MDAPRLLDLFCKAGGASEGYARAGFVVVGVDIEPQPNYPFTFYQADALTFPLDSFDAIHASPPCQAFSSLTPKHRRSFHLDLVVPTRSRLQASGIPFVIENVPGAPLVNPFQLCGSTFGLDVRRHRLFETGHWAPPTAPPCAHEWQTPRFRTMDKRRKGRLSCVVPVYGQTNFPGDLELRRKAMGISWMTNKELCQAIPPAYTEWIGTHLFNHLER